MRIFLWLIALFVAATGLAVTARFNVGNVVLFYPPYRIDLSLNLFILLALVAFLLLYALIRTVRNARKMPDRVASYRQQKSERDGNQALRDALKALYEGRFVQAEKAAARAEVVHENAGCAALIGARAAHAMRQHDRRDAWLAKIGSDNAFRTARLISAIELLVDDHQTKAALKVIDELNATGTRHIHAQRWALKANQQARNWDEVLRLVRTLDNHKAIHPALSARLRELAYEDLLSAHPHDAESIRRVWQKIPSDDRKRPYVAVRAANAFNKVGLHDNARQLVVRALSEEWDERLLRVFRDSAADEGSPALLEQIEQSEEWLNRRPADHELALTLGSLCLKQKLWGKAQRHLEQALLGETDTDLAREAHFRLALLHESLKQPEQAAKHYRECALLSRP
ncbi:MAG: heme biosynthesis protein HemY [Burkholderiaceae bacterium]|nr:heme biosynthesis protein HemY [Burkholderiaceae bacterium]